MAPPSTILTPDRIARRRRSPRQGVALTGVVLDPPEIGGLALQAPGLRGEEARLDVARRKLIGSSQGRGGEP